MEIALTHLPEVRDPFDAPHDWYALIDLAGPSGTLEGILSGDAEGSGCGVLQPFQKVHKTNGLLYHQHLSQVVTR
jgi:hypothetical protein